MESINRHFNLYDMFGFLASGLVIVLNIYLLYSEQISSFYLELKYTNTILDIIFIILLSYIFGHFLEESSNIFEKYIIYNTKLKFIGRSYPSMVFLNDDNTHFHSEFKTNIINMIDTIFNLSENHPQRNKFELCYTFILQKGLPSRVERYLGLQAFCRNVGYSFFICIIINLYLSLQYDYNNLFLLSASYFIVGITFIKRHIFYGSKFVDSIYREFYVYISSLK